MASVPSVETVLTKIIKHNPEVIGCIAATDEDIYTNLPEAYDLVDSEGIVEHASNAFKVTDALETGRPEFDQMYLEYESHSFYARRMDDAILVLLNNPIRRANFKKMKIGLNLFLQPLERALNSKTRRRNGRADSDQVGRLRRLFGSLA